MTDTTWRGVCVHWEGIKAGVTGWRWPWDHSTCDNKVRGTQNYHMDAQGWDDIAYNFVACPHDVVFEGRGWTAKNTANGSSTLNGEWLAVCYLAAVDTPLTDGGKRAMRWVIDEAARRGHPEVTTHRRIRPTPTTCPGDVIDSWVMAGCPATSAPPPPLPDPSWLDEENCVRDQLIFDPAVPGQVWLYSRGFLFPVNSLAAMEAFQAAGLPGPMSVSAEVFACYKKTTSF